MAYVALSTASQASRLASAEARWGAIAATRPDLAPAVELQKRLLGIVIELAEAIERGRLPRLSLPPKYVAAKLAKGVPALAGEPVPLPVPVLKPALARLCGALAQGGAGEAAAHIQASLDATEIDAGSLLSASLNRDQKAIRTGAVHRGLAPDLLWLVAELAVSPFAHALQQCLFADGSPLRQAADAWTRGYCPMCGSWPALAEVVDGRRTLRCSFCALAWELAGYGCVYCGEQGEAFVTAAPDGGRTDRCVEVCGACTGYLKAIETGELSPFPLLAIADLETMDLDVAAMERGYTRPPLKEFGGPL